MADGDLISRTSLLKGIEELKESPWFKRGKLEETDTNVDYNRSLYHIGYLERKEAIEIIIDLCIKKEPTVEAQPVKHGRWIIDYAEGSKIYHAHCSECNKEPDRNIGGDYYIDKMSDFCPNCGARMDGDSE